MRRNDSKSHGARKHTEHKNKSKLTHETFQNERRPDEQRKKNQHELNMMKKRKKLNKEAYHKRSCVY